MWVRLTLASDTEHKTIAITTHKRRVSWHYEGPLESSLGLSLQCSHWLRKAFLSRTVSFYSLELVYNDTDISLARYDTVWTGIRVQEFRRSFLSSSWALECWDPCTSTHCVLSVFINRAVGASNVPLSVTSVHSVHRTEGNREVTSDTLFVQFCITKVTQRISFQVW